MGVIDNAKEIADLVKKVGDIDLYRKIVALESEILDLTREKRQLEEKVSNLEQSLAFKEKLVFKEPLYWLEGDGTPYCPGCWVEKRQAVHLMYRYNYKVDEQWDCPICKFEYLVYSDRKEKQ